MELALNIQNYFTYLLHEHLFFIQKNLRIILNNLWLFFSNHVNLSIQEQFKKKKKHLKSALKTQCIHLRKTLLRATGDTYTLKWISWSESKKQAVHWYFTGDLHNGYRVSPISSGGDLRLVHSSGLGKRNPEARSQCIQYELLRAPNRHWLRGKKRGRKSSQDERERAMLYYLNERRCGLRVERFFFFFFF